MVVKRSHVPVERTKMDGQAQTIYNRKNWSSVCLWNLGHPANSKLTVEMVNRSGTRLKRICWLEDAEIGECPLKWNYLAGSFRYGHPAEPASLRLKPTDDAGIRARTFRQMSGSASSRSSTLNAEG